MQNHKGWIELSFDNVAKQDISVRHKKLHKMFEHVETQVQHYRLEKLH